MIITFFLNSQATSVDDSTIQKALSNSCYDETLKKGYHIISHENSIQKVTDLLDKDPSIQNYIAQKDLWDGEEEGSVWYYEDTPLHANAFDGNTAMAKLLIQDYDFQVDARQICSIYSTTPLHEAIYWEKYDMVELLLSLGADKSLGGKRHGKPFKNAMEMVKILQAEQGSDKDELKRIEELLKPRDTNGMQKCRK